MKAPGDVPKVYPTRLQYAESVEWTTTDEILQWCMCMDPGKHGRPEQMRVAASIKRLGWKQDRVLVDGIKERRWVRASVVKGDEADDGVPF